MSLGFSTIMIDLNKKYTILEDILKSNSFINSKLNSKLLTYLVECEITNKTPSEYSIALDVFKKDSSFNPNEDTLIRVSVYNLRKKLERYYLNMGKQCRVRVKIPKGHYEVVFFNHTKEKTKNFLSNSHIMFISIILILFFIIAYLLSISVPKNNSQIISELKTSYYSDIITSINPMLVTLGNDFIYFSDYSEFKTTPIRKMVRNSAINTEAEFEKFKSKNKDLNNLEKLPFSFFNQASIWPLPKIAILLNSLNKSYSLKSSSTLTSNDIKNNDVIFLGSFWTLGILNQFLRDEDIQYSIIGGETLTIDSFASDSTLYYTRKGVPAYDHDDYCLFMKVPGPNNNIIYFFISFYATGSMGAVNYLTNIKSLKILENKLNDKFGTAPRYYKLVFKSTGYDREVLSTELIYLDKINKVTLKR